MKPFPAILLTFCSGLVLGYAASYIRKHDEDKSLNARLQQLQSQADASHLQYVSAQTQLYLAIVDRRKELPAHALGFLADLFASGDVRQYWRGSLVASVASAADPKNLQLCKDALFSSPLASSSFAIEHVRYWELCAKLRSRSKAAAIVFGDRMPDAVYESDPVTGSVRSVPKEEYLMGQPRRN